MSLTQEQVTETEEVVSFHKGGVSWHDGPGWYYVLIDYPDEGSFGSFETLEEAQVRAYENEVVG